MKTEQRMVIIQYNNNNNNNMKLFSRAYRLMANLHRAENVAEGDI